MHNVEPKYFLIGIPEDTGDLEAFLEGIGSTWRPDPAVSWTENVMEFAGRLCYNAWKNEDGSFTNLNLTKVREGNKEYLGNIIKQGHFSVFEHGGPLTLLFANVSRVFTHELVRHRTGCGYSQTSGRYVRSDDIGFWMPPVIAGNTKAAAIFKRVIEFSEAAQKELAETFDIDALPFHEKKQLTSAFRRILPNGQANHILMSVNHRAMRHILTMRSSEGAELEIRNIFRTLGLDLKQRFPNIYQDMIVSELGEITFESAGH